MQTAEAADDKCAGQGKGGARRSNQVPAVTKAAE
jgi:hypothetical protein